MTSRIQQALAYLAADQAAITAVTRPDPPATEATEPAALPPFSGDETTCPKCSNLGAFTRHRAADEHGSDEHATFGPSPRGERLERTCTRCDYIWDEALNPPSDGPTTP